MFAWKDTKTMLEWPIRWMWSKLRFYFTNVHYVILVVVTKILQKGIYTSWNFTSARWFSFFRNSASLDTFFSFQVTFDKAIQLASARAHERYTSHGSPPIKFNPDIRVSFAVEWILSSLKLDYGSMGALDVTSYSYVIFPEPMKNSNDTNSTLSGVLTIIAHLKRKATYSQGYYYCKLLSPSRALEWYYIDALKKSTDS